MSVAVVVTDSNVDPLHGDAFVRSLEDGGAYDRVERIVIPAGEKTKTLESYAALVRAFAQFELTRKDVAYALGGGVVGDLTGFAAATYMRGIDVIQVPTTLLAMVDSSIGGKTGVDIPEGKNLVGAFHLPKKIIRDVKFLETLPEREMKNGLAEMIKTAVLFDPEMFEILLAARKAPPRGTLTEYRVSPRSDFSLPFAKLIERTASWKQKIVDEDFKEGGKRKLLNLGHTFGHAIEKVSGFAIPHGAAVAIGMRIVGKDVPEIGEILDAYGYPKYEGFDDAKILEAIRGDKKRTGETITLIVPRKIGECELVETPMSELESWLR